MHRRGQRLPSGMRFTLACLLFSRLQTLTTDSQRAVLLFFCPKKAILARQNHYPSKTLSPCYQNFRSKRKRLIARSFAGDRWAISGCLYAWEPQARRLVVMVATKRDLCRSSEPSLLSTANLLYRWERMSKHFTTFFTAETKLWKDRPRSPDIVYGPFETRKDESDAWHWKFMNSPTRLVHLVHASWSMHWSWEKFKIFAGTLPRTRPWEGSWCFDTPDARCECFWRRLHVQRIQIFNQKS